MRCLSLFLQARDVGLPSNRKAGEISNVFTQSQCPIDVEWRLLALKIAWGESIVLFDQALCAFFETSAILLSPPVLQISLCIETLTLVIEAMADIMTDNLTDFTEI